MPLIRQRVEPSALARKPKCLDIVDYDLTAVTNVSLCGAMRQLASLLSIGERICGNLTEELNVVIKNSNHLAQRLVSLETKISQQNPRTVPVPESDLGTFSTRSNNYKGKYELCSSFFTPESRPPDITEKYEKIAPTPIHTIRELDAIRSDGQRSSRYFNCEPVMGNTLEKEKNKKLNLDIETRRPASFVTLREWGSDDETFVSELELLPVSPSVTCRPPPAPHPSTLKLPLPEQRLLALSQKYPPELVSIDVSGKGFVRMQSFRQSLVHYDYSKTKRRRKRLKRRNTIADSRDARSTVPSNQASSSCPDSSSRCGFSIDRSFDTSSTKTSSEREVPSQLFGLKIPGSDRGLHTSTYRRNEDLIGEEDLIVVSEVRKCELKREKKKDLNISFDLSDKYAYNGGERLEHRMKASVKMREGNSREEGTRSSSGNWSGSSTRTSIESENHQVYKSHHSPNLTPSFEQDSFNSDSPPVQSLSSGQYRTSDELVSRTSDGTLTPTQDIQDIPFADDDTSSAFSCDTEGYYTSFHIDSGIRDNKLASDSEWEGLGRASTGTTNSSASLKTVIMRNPDKKTPPKPPQRVSSLERKDNRESIITVIHVNGSTSSDISSASSEGDSGRGTASADPPAEDKDNFRLKTAINTSGIPSMCSITPPHSDDENKSIQIEKPLAVVESKIYQKSLQKQTPSVRQPGDGAATQTTKEVTLTVMSQKRASGDLGSHFKGIPSETSTPKPIKEPYTLNKSVVARRAEIQMKVLGEKSEPQKQKSPQEQDKLVAYKDLPPMTSSSNLVTKQTGTTPPNSLERSNITPVTVDNDGKVVYTSGSLPRRQGHTSFEPGPYVKPAAKTIQQMPLPPVPPDLKEKPVSQSNSITQTLSGLSSQMQPRTVSQIQAMRYAHKESRTENQDIPKSTNTDLATGSVSLQFRLQQQIKEQHIEAPQVSSNLTTIPEQALPHYQSLSYQQKLIQQAYQQQQQLQQLQEEQQKLKEEKQRMEKPREYDQNRTEKENYFERQQMQRQQLIYQQQQMAAYQQPYQMQDAQRQQHILQQAQLAAEHDQMQKQAAYKKDYNTQDTTALLMAQQEMQAAQAAALGQEYSMYQRPSAYYPTSRAPTPVQSTANRIQSTTLSNTQRNQSGVVYGPLRGLHETNRRATPIPPSMMSSAPPNEQYNLTNSDIYGRIGMTRQVYVGGTLPAGFGRNQRAYSSLPPNTRQPTQESFQRQQQSNKVLTRRASVVGTESAQQPVQDKHDKKNNKKEKKKKETKEAKPEKPAKKKWFWTLPLRRKKKNKEEEGTEDDDGGFKAASQKNTRKVPNTEDTSFIRYPSPDTGSSDMNSSYSSDYSGDHGYRSSPSAEVYYYTQKAQTNHLLASTTQRAVTGAIMSGNIPLGMTRDLLQGGLGTIPRSHSSTPVSPIETQRTCTMPVMSVAGDNGEITDLTRSRRYMSREEMYAAMRHPQYYKTTGSPSDYSQTTVSSRSNSPAVFNLNPPTYVMKPQVKEGYSIPPMEQMAAVSHHGIISKSTNTQSYLSNRSRDSDDGKKSDDIDPPMGYGENNSSPTDSQEDVSTASTSSAASTTSSKPFAKQTTLLDFKKMILEKSMKSAGGKERVSAVEMLKASRPSIYGYSPPPAPVVKPQESPSMPREGIIMPPNSRNTARALLFQSRFGSGGRYRTHRTEIISTTIVEDKNQEEIEYSDEEYESSEDGSDSSPDRHSVVSLRLPVSMIEESANESDKKHNEERNHSTPVKPIRKAVETPNVSAIMPPDKPDAEAVETSL